MDFIWNWKSLVPWIKYSISDLAMWHVWYYAAWFSSGTCQLFSSYTKWWHLFYTTLLGVNINKLWFICIPFLSPSNIPWHEILGLYLYPWLHFYAFPSFSFCGNTFIPSLHFHFLEDRQVGYLLQKIHKQGASYCVKNYVVLVSVHSHLYMEPTCRW